MKKDLIAEVAEGMSDWLKVLGYVLLILCWLAAMALPLLAVFCLLHYLGVF